MERPPENKTPFTPSHRSLPARMSIKVLDDELIITRHWRGPVQLVLLGIVSFLLTFGLFFSDVPTVMFLFNPLTWFIIGLGYYGLKELVNRTVVRITPTRLTVKEGPLLPRRRIEVASGNVVQLYVKKEIQSGHKNRTTSYHLHLVRQNGEEQQIISNLETREQALFLEQEIERFLGLEDQATLGEQSAAGPRNFDGWRTFADSNGLHYTYGKVLTGHRVHGLCQGYQVELVVEQPGLPLTFQQPRLTMRLTDQTDRDQDPPNPYTLESVTTLFAAPVQSPLALTGKITLTDKGRTFSYEEGEVRTDAAYLQAILDSLVDLSEAQSHIVASGGAVMPVLHAVARDKKHPARAVAAQLMKEIAPTTEHLASAEEMALLCPDCLVRVAVHKLDLGGLTGVSYYGCRQCHQSQNFLTVKTVVAVLDHRSGPEPVQQGQTLTVNWLTRPTLFDFDTVKIMDATDEEVERFAVQVGNDTDPVRKERYQQIPCLVSPECKLSENTVRILRRIFG